MRYINMKNSAAALTFITLAVVASLAFGLLSRNSVTVKAAQTTGVTLPSVNIYTLTSDNMIYVLKPGTTGFASVGRVPRANGNLIGIDFRPKDGALYALTDTGKVLLLNLTTSPLGATVVSTLSPRFAGGFQSLMDFNPVLDAIRIIGSNKQNFAVVNSGGNLNLTAVTTAMSYDPKDVNASASPSISAGAYTNNYVGAPFTLFYGIDYDLDTFVTISTKNATGSSNTSGGVLQTIGPIVNKSGVPININPTADLDIYTDANGVNILVGINNETIFTIDLNQLNPALALGTTQNVVASTFNLPVSPPADAFIDIAISTAAPAPAPTPAPVTTYQAENGLLGGGNWIMTNWPGYTGTGFVDFADGVAGGFCEFTISQTGSRTLTFRYANGSTVNRPCSLTVNGTPVDTIYFAPTGAWSTWANTSTTINLGATAGAKVRLTSTTTAGGPNLDKVDVQ